MKLKTETNLPFGLHVESPKYHEIFDPIHIHILYVNGLNPLLFNSCIGTLGNHCSPRDPTKKKIINFHTLPIISHLVDE